MKKIVSFLVVVFIFYISNAQDTFLEIQNTLKTSNNPIKQSFSVINKLNNDFAFFLLDAKETYAYLYNEKLENISKLSTKSLPRKFKVLIGSSISNDNHYRLFLTNTKKTLFGTIDFSFETGNTEVKELDLKLPGQDFIQTFTYKNNFYILTALANTSTLIFYKFDDEGNYTRNEIRLSEEEFVNSRNKPVALYNLFVKGSGLSERTLIEKIESSNPNAIETTSAFTKMYQLDNEVVLTFDENKEITQIIQINLDDFSVKTRQFKKPLQDVSFNNKQTNTFVFNDTFFTIASTNNNILFSAYNFDDFKHIKTHEAKVEDDIYFKNSPIIQRGGAYKAYREMEKTQKFLRKITNADVGISVYTFDNTYQITLGGKQEIARGGFGFGFGGAIGGASFGAINVFFNPTFSAYNSYNNSKSTYINCLFDKNVEHLNGVVIENVFDKLFEYQNKYPFLKNQTVFKYKDFILLGHRSTKSSKKYILRKFED